MINKHIKMAVGIVLGVATLIAFFNFNKADAQYAVTTCTSATLNGYVDTNNDNTSAWFEWGTSPSLGNSTNQQTFSYNTGYSAQITGLSANNTYYFRAMAQNSQGNAVGDIISFHTTCNDQPATPTPATPPSGNISASPASCVLPTCSKIDLNWNSRNVATIIKVYRDGQDWLADNANQSGSASDWNPTEGSHEYCLRAVDANWSLVSGNLDCARVTVSSAPVVIQNPTVSINASTTNCNTNTCDIRVNWSSSNVENLVNITRSPSAYGFPWNENANTSGVETDWNLTNGSYTYCIQAINNNWQSYGDQKCATVAVNVAPAVVNNPTATISSTTPCTAPCNVVVSWSSRDVASYPNVVKIYKNGSFLWNQEGNTVLNQFSETEWNMPAGTYRYCIRAVKSDWSETGDLACTTSVVTAPTVAPATCQDRTALNFGATGACNYHVVVPPVTCTDRSANNFGATGNCTYTVIPPVTCQDRTALNYGATGACNYHVVVPPVTCTDRSANNFGATGNCTYTIVTPPQNIIPTVTISANPANIAYNGSSTVTWSSTNAVSCVASNGANGWSGNRAVSGSFNTGALTNTLSYNITCTSSTGHQMAGSTIVTVGSQPIVHNTNNASCSSLSAPNTVKTGESFNATVVMQNTGTTTWNSTLPNNYNITVSPWASTWNWGRARVTSDITPGSSYTFTVPLVAPSVAGTYALNTQMLQENIEWFGSKCSPEKTITVVSPVIVPPAPQLCQDTNANNYNQVLPCTYTPAPQARPIVTMTIDDSEIAYNTSTVVRWTSQNATACYASGGTNGWTGERALAGNFATGQLTVDKSFTIICTNNVSSDSKSVSVRVGTVQFGVPVVTLSADNINLDTNGTTFIRWTSANANVCNATAGVNGWTGVRSLTGNFYTGELTATTTYNITCTNNVGTDSKSVTVRVNTVVPPTPVVGDPTVTLTSDASTVSSNGNTTVRWSSTNASSCTATNGTNGWAGTKTLSGSFNTGALRSATTYNITCVNSTGKTATANVLVNIRARFVVITL